MSNKRDKKGTPAAGKKKPETVKKGQLPVTMKPKIVKKGTKKGKLPPTAAAAPIDPSRLNAGIRKKAATVKAPADPGKAGAPKTAKPGAPPQPLQTAGQVSTRDSGGVDPNRPIGPGNPPRSGIIKPGEVRNPKGYPKGRPNAKTVIKYWLGQEEDVLNPLNPAAKVEGDYIKVTVLDSMTIALIGRARKGDVSAYRELLDRIEGKPVQSTKLLNADDKLLHISVGFAAPGMVEAKEKEGDK